MQASTAVVSQVLVSLISAIAKASTMVLETALKKTEEGEGDEILSEFGFETDPNLTVLGAPSTWNSLLTMSLTQNSSLKGKMVGNHTIRKNLNKLISSISDKESKELEETTEFGYFGEVKKSGYTSGFLYGGGHCPLTAYHARKCSAFCFPAEEIRRKFLTALYICAKIKMYIRPDIDRTTLSNAPGFPAKHIFNQKGW